MYSDSVRIAFLPNVIGDSLAAAWANGAKSYLDTFPNVSFDTFDGKASVDTQVQIKEPDMNALTRTPMYLGS